MGGCGWNFSHHSIGHAAPFSDRLLFQAEVYKPSAVELLNICLTALNAPQSWQAIARISVGAAQGRIQVSGEKEKRNGDNICSHFDAESRIQSVLDQIETQKLLEFQTA
jgi:hypothetical protein